MHIKQKIVVVLGATALALSGCSAPSSFDGYVHAECGTTDANKVTTCSVTEKPVPTATVTATPAPTTPAPTPTPTPTATSPAPTPTPTPTAACGPAPANPAAVPALPAADDHREWMHGMDIVKHSGRNLVTFASNGYPPTQPTGEWMHNIFGSYIDACDAAGTFTPQVLVAAPNAQEPASSAVNSNGRLLITAEDAQFSSYLDQTYGLWDTNLSTKIVPYGQKLMPPQGGHSGHVAASGDKFGVSFSDGWVDGGGVDNNGTGDDVFFKVVDNAGVAGSMINTAVGTANRDWWPIVAGSDTNFLQVWQRYGGVGGTGGGKVMGAIISQTGQIVKPAFDIFTNDKYYYHDVQYVPALGLYLVVGSQNTSTNAGIAVLLDKAGNVVSTKTGLPNTIREGQTVISDDGKTAVYAGGPGAVVLDLAATGVTLRKTVSLAWNWDYMGTDGVFATPNRVVFATGTQQGVKFLNVDF